MKYSYEITPRPVEVGGGWKLRLLEGEEEVGGGVFPVHASAALQGVAWWNQLAEQERGHWLQIAASAVPADAWHAYLNAGAYEDAETVAYQWLDSRNAT